jgi:hypothetical protein
MLADVCGQAFKTMVDAAYDSFQVLMEEAEEISIDVNDIYELTVFDLVRCNTEEEWKIICEAENNGSMYEELQEIVFQ